MFNDSESFFYSEHSDLTNTLQRNETKSDESKKLPLWKTVGISYSITNIVRNSVFQNHPQRNVKREFFMN